MLIFSTLDKLPRKKYKIIKKNMHKCVRCIKKCRTFASQKRKSK